MVSSAITINPLAQTIFVQASTSAIIVAGNANLTIVGAQGTGARSFSVVSGPCTISGSTLTGSGVGACSVIGAVAADSNYLAATTAPISVNVSQSSSSVALTASASNIGKYENNGALIDNRFNTAGADMLIAPGFKAGIAMGYGRDRTDVGLWGSKSTAGGLAATAYGSCRVYGPLFIDALAGIGDARMKSRRALPGEFENAVGQRNGLYWYGSAALTWEQKWERLSLAPYLRLDVIRGSLDSYVESGPQIAALAYDSASIRSTSGIFGLRGGYDIPMDWGVLAPMARLEYRRVIENDVNQALSYANEGGIVYPMLVNGVSRNLLQAGLGLRAKRASTATDAGVSGEIEYLFGTAGSEFTSHALRGAVKIAW